MKKIIFLSILVSIMFAQQKSLLELKAAHNAGLKNVKFELKQQTTVEKKNAGLAIIYSLLLPGMGELYAGDYSSGKYFTMAEAGLWGFYAGFKIYGNNKQDDYEAFAAAFADADLEGKDEDYFTYLGLYNDVDEYNRDKLISGRFNEVYEVETHYWKWDSNEQRKEYRGLWKSSENAKNNIRFAVGGMILNRLVSAINAARLVRSHNKRIEDLSWNMGVNLVRMPDNDTGIQFGVTARF